MEIKRDVYLDKLIRKKKNGMVKVVTGIRRCGKSYLLFRLFHKHLADSGIPEDHIIEIALDDRSNKMLRNPDVILKVIKEKIRDKQDYYILLDEVQYLEEFEDVLNSLMHIHNADVYVTGSNSQLLSTDVITQFRGRGDEIRIYPLSFFEYMSVFKKAKERALDEYLMYGGLPQILTLEEHEDKEEYLTSLLKKVYISDIIERYNVRNKAELDELIDVIASAVGSYTSSSKLARTFKSVKKNAISDKTITKYIDYMINSYLISRAERYDIKGKKYIGKLSKYFFEDTGLRNARIGFRQIEETHLMENIIYNELRIRGYHVDVGIVEHFGTNADGKRGRKQLEVDFVATRGSEKYYIQSAYALPDADKVNQEQRGLLSISDFFRKIIIVRDDIEVRRDEHGIIKIGLKNFLLNKNSLML